MNIICFFVLFLLNNLISNSKICCRIGTTVCFMLSARRRIVTMLSLSFRQPVVLVRQPVLCFRLGIVLLRWSLYLFGNLSYWYKSLLMLLLITSLSFNLSLMRRKHCVSTNHLLLFSVRLSTCLLPAGDGGGAKKNAVPNQCPTRRFLISLNYICLSLVYVLCCAVLCCAVLCCAVLCCAVLCCKIYSYKDTIIQ